MSQLRQRPDASWADRAALRRGPGGRPLCRRCGAEVPKGRSTFCSGRRATFAYRTRELLHAGTGCVHAWLLGSDAAYLRKHVFARDRGVCAACALDCEQVARDLVAASRARDEPRMLALYELATGRARLTGHGALWEADHIVPVVEGGGFDPAVDPLANIRTLCCRCHKRASAELAGRRAGRRRGDETGGPS